MALKWSEAKAVEQRKGDGYPPINGESPYEGDGRARREGSA